MKSSLLSVINEPNLTFQLSNMIRVHLTEKFKSLTEVFSIDLPDFTIISGVNGAGKSHLLTAISQNLANVTNEKEVQLTNKKFINSNSLVPNDAYQVSRDSLKYEITNLHQSIQQFKIQKITNPELTLRKHLEHNKPQFNLLKNISRKTEINVEDLTLEDINDNFPIQYGIVNDVFYQNFSQIFKRYYDRYEDNLFKEYLNKTRNSSIKFLSESDFVAQFNSPPWEFVNQIFEESNLDYRVNDPLMNDRDLPFTFSLINKINGANVSFSDLSSGEKVLMSLTLSLYNSKFDVDFPEIILLDEPDAPLHPSMAKQLLQVINEVFVKGKGVKVIMTTHSPSTIAMAPDDSLFVMKKESPRIQKQSKEHIMKLLTDGIPSFSVYADNRRQVFTESQTDANFYNKAYEKLKGVLTSDKSLYFISSGVVRGNTGNCEQVKEIVNLLRSNGNQTVFGVIDWDTVNTSRDGIFVLGESKRYSLDNYVFDPIVIAILLLRELIVPKSDFGLSEDEYYYDIYKMPQHRIQNIVDIMIDTISKHVVVENPAVNIVNYQNNISLKIPVWYLRHNGHELEEIIRKAYHNKLNKFKREEIVDKILEDHKGFISFDIIDLFQNLLL